MGAEEMRLTRRERERLQHKREILDVALRLFSERGYYSVSMEEIAKEAEFSVGTLYNFFKSKEELYKSLVKEVADRFHSSLTKAIEKRGSVIERLRNYLRIKGDIFRENLPVIRFYFTETRGVSLSVIAGLELELREQYNSFLERLSHLFEYGMEEGIFKRIADPFYLAVALDSISNSFLFLWLQDPDAYPYPEPELVLNIFFKGLLRSES
ncbi:MAG: TetR/AcrR family transcriptional regulator [Deltaproteobacteria bacterium]|nr:MAG: TetR/AcrR family transcriptional regulator [Deltaproteobacteria bacterium]